MKIAGIAMIKNEADIVEAFVRHNITYLDVMVVIENSSTDGSREILLALQREGLPIVIFDDPIFGYFQSEKMSHIYRKTVIEFMPDFIFLLDADEFINVKSRPILESQLSLIKKGSVGRIPWKTYIPSPDNCEENITDILRQIPYRRNKEFIQRYKAVIPARVTDFGLTIYQGNHLVYDASHQIIPPLDIPDITLGHFPIRSIDQFTSKVIVGWMAYLERNRTKPDKGFAYQWKDLYERIIRGNSLTKQELIYEALHYSDSPTDVSNFTWPESVIKDPIEPNYTHLKYLHLGKTNTLSNVVNSFDQFFKQNLMGQQELNLAAIKKLGK